jgi:hypothetical protein
LEKGCAMEFEAMKMRHLKIITILLLFTFYISAQDKAKITEWRGLVLDEATPEKAIEVLGKPKSDKPSAKFRPLKFNEWFDVEKKRFRKLHWKNAQQIEGFSDVKLYFRDDKLISIWLEPNDPEANTLQITYADPFIYLSDKFAESTEPRDFERNQGRSYPKSFPTVYFLMNTNTSAYAFVMVANNSFGSILGKSIGVKDASESLPGDAKIINLISKSIETKKGTNLLK